MRLDAVSSLGPLAHESDAVPAALRSRAGYRSVFLIRYSYRYKLIDILYII